MSESYVYPTGRTAEQVYEELHATTDYATTEHGMNTEYLYADCKSLLDAGCGRSPFAVRIAKELALDVWALDISLNAMNWQAAHAAKQHGWLIPVRGDLTQGLWCKVGQFDVVTCFDVLEHLPPERVGFAIRELCRVARKRVVITVGTEPSKRKGPGGEELHLTVNPHGWWQYQLSANVWPSFDNDANRIVVRTEQIKARIRRGQPAVSIVFIVELQP